MMDARNSVRAKRSVRARAKRIDRPSSTAPSAAAVITVVGVVFSITILALQLASTQFGPRMLRNFIRDIGTQVTLGTFVATFGTTVGNFHWQEWGIDGGTADGTAVTSEGNTTPGLVNHKIADLGTKTSAASWVFTVTITLS